MAADDEQWVSDLQYRCVVAGLGVMQSWVGAEQEQEEALISALNRAAVPGEVVVGLATVSRLLTIELAAATGRTEQEVLHAIGEITAGLQHSGERHGGA